MLKQRLVASLVAIFTSAMSGCMVVGAGIGAGIGASAADSLDEKGGIVEVGEVKTKLGASVSLLKTTKISSAVFEKDMETHNASPALNDIKVNATITDEVKRSLNVAGNTVSPVTIHLRTIYHNSYPGSSWYYLGVTERSALSYMQTEGVRKVVNTHLMLEDGTNHVLLEVHGLWASGNNGDEIAGARKLAREMASEVLKKLSTASAPPRESVAEAKKE